MYSVHMYMYDVYVHVCICTYVCMYSIHVCMCMYIYMCMYICVYVQYTCMIVHVCVCTVYMYECTHMYIHNHMYMYTYMYMYMCVQIYKVPLFPKQASSYESLVICCVDIELILKETACTCNMYTTFYSTVHVHHHTNHYLLPTLYVLCVARLALQ